MKQKQVNKFNDANKVERNHLIDLLKGFCVFFVILHHIFFLFEAMDGWGVMETNMPTSVQMGFPFYVYQAIPFYLMITGFIGAFKEYNSIISIFGAPSTAGSGGASTEKNLLTVVYYVYDILEHDSQTMIQYGAAGAVLLFVVILLFTLVQNKVSKSRVYY